jgi:hypothetical protein
MNSGEKPNPIDTLLDFTSFTYILFANPGILLAEIGD